MARKKIRQSLTFDPMLDAALRCMFKHSSTRVKGTRLNYNGYLEGILSAYVKGRFGKIPTPEDIDSIVKQKMESNG